MHVAEDARVIELVTALACERERNKRLEALLRNLADHDPLTDLLNRRSLEREIDDHQARCARYGPEGALLLVGLDGLGQAAAAFGPQAADEALCRLADGVVGRLGATDVVGRWGPDELAVLLPRASVAEVAVVAVALVGIVGSTSLQQLPPGSLVGSVGVALMVAPPVEADRLVAHARGALTTARRRGGGWTLSQE